MSGSVADVRFEDGIAVPGPGGIKLATDVFRPAGAGRFPALLLRTPYDRRVAQTVGFAAPAWYAARGFAVAVQDVRGTGGSEGRFELFASEADDGAASAAWLAGQPWCDGRVGTYGYSYCGAIQPMTAAQGGSPIAAMAAGFYSLDVCSEWAYPGGVLSLAFLLSWSIDLRLGAARVERDHDLASRLEQASAEVPRLCRVLPLGDLTAELDLGSTPWGTWLHREPESSFWERYSGLEVDPALPTLHFGGWYDIFSTGTIAGYRRSRGPRRLLMGPWLHAPWNWTPRAPGRLIDDQVLAWFEHFLAAGAAPPELPVRAFALGSERWFDFEDWPPPGVVEAALHLRSSGRANSSEGDGRLSPEPPGGGEPGDVFVYDPARPLPAAGGHSCCDPAVAPAGPAPQNDVESSPGMLVYTSEPLRASVLLAGPVAVELSVRTSVSETDLVATLCRVDRDGRSINLLEGATRVRDHGEGGPLKIELGEICAGLAPGERLRLDVSSSRFPQWRRSLNRADLGSTAGSLADAVVARTELLHDDRAPSTLTLPLSPAGGWSGPSLPL